MSGGVVRAACPHDLTIAEFSGLFYPLTSCCGASGKGTGAGVSCRDCYEIVDPTYGDVCEEFDVKVVTTWLAQLGCPSASRCAYELEHKLELAREQSTSELAKRREYAPTRNNKEIK